jgi:hypothetical protein
MRWISDSGTGILLLYLLLQGLTSRKKLLCSRQKDELCAIFLHCASIIKNQGVEDWQKSLDHAILISHKKRGLN